MLAAASERGMAGAVAGFVPRIWPGAVFSHSHASNLDGAEYILRLSGACAELGDASADSGSGAVCDRADCHLHFGAADYAVWAGYSRKPVCSDARRSLDCD